MQFGQFRRTPNYNFITFFRPKDSLATNDYERGQLQSSQTGFRDPCVTFFNGFQSDTSYYICFSIKESTERRKFTLKLKNMTNNEEQILQSYIIDPNKEKNWKTFEIVFTPNNSGYGKLVWELTRENVDYLIEEGRKIEWLGNNKEIRIEPNDPESLNPIYLFASVNNVIDSLGEGVQELAKIGIQGPPSMLMCINGQQIRLGKNGIYEINNGIIIDFVGFIPKNNDYFIMDYEY